MLTQAQLDEIEARWNATSKGPWRTDRDAFRVLSKKAARRKAPPGYPIFVVAQCLMCCGQVTPHNYEEMHANARAIAHAREDVPKLVAEVRRLKGEPD